MTAGECPLVGPTELAGLLWLQDGNGLLMKCSNLGGSGEPGARQRHSFLSSLHAEGAELSLSSQTASAEDADHVTTSMLSAQSH